MKINGDYLFDAPRDVVWEGLQDPEVLASVLPGCEKLELVGENAYEGALKIKVGPVQGAFKGKVTLADLQAPESYSMDVDGRGAPGFVKAKAQVRLLAEENQTRMEYESDARVGGRIASVGQRLLDSSAKAIIRQSLEGLNATLQARAGGGDEGAEGAEEDSGSQPAAPQPPSQMEFATNVAKEVAKDVAKDVGGTRLLIGAVAIIAIVALLYFLLMR